MGNHIFLSGVTARAGLRSLVPTTNLINSNLGSDLAATAAGARDVGGNLLCGWENVDGSECEFVGKSKSGLSQHRRSRHAERYHNEIANDIAARGSSKTLWSTEESSLLISNIRRMRRENGGVELSRKRVGELIIEAHLTTRTLGSILGELRKEPYQAALTGGDLVDMVVAPAPSVQSQVVPEEQWNSRIAREEALGNLRELITGLPEGADLQAITPGQSCEANQLVADLHYRAFDELYRIKTKEPRGGGGRTARINPKGVGKSCRRRRAQFARIQRWFKRNRGRCADAVLSGTWSADTPDIPMRDQETFWREIFEKPSNADARTPVPVRQEQLEVIRPISCNDVKLACAAISADTAPGPDGRRKSDVLGIPTAEMANLFNIWMYLGCQPSGLHLGYTTLVPKVAGTDQPAKHRPITVQSILVRIFHRVLAGRLETACPVDERQKGFRPGDGLAQNLKILESILQEAQDVRKPRNLFLCFLDVRKAFDSVSHESLILACRRAGVPEPLVCYIESIYREAKIALRVGGQLSEIIRVLQGVKQGDPLSSVLFNLVIDWAVAGLDRNIAASLCKQQISYLAFADDMVLFSKTREGLQRQAEHFVSGLAASGLSLNAAKCRTMAIVVQGKQRKWVCDPAAFLRIDGEEVPGNSITETYKYLGLEFNPREANSSALAKLVERTRQLSKAPLKPQQRLWILKEKLLPSLLHDLVLSKCTYGLLADLDRRVRLNVRSWLRLPRDAPLPFFYADVRDGGLGIMNLRFAIPPLRAQRLRGMLGSVDQVVKAVVSTATFKNQLSKWSRQGVFNGYYMSSKALCRTAFRESLVASADGRGSRHANLAPGPQRWIDSGRLLLTGARYIAAVGVRANTLPTKARCGRGRPDAIRHCGACGPDVLETLGHILQICPRTHGARINRHDIILRLLAKRLEKLGWQVKVELRITTSAGLRKPDLLAFKHGCQAWVIDVGVSAVSVGSLDEPYDQKVVKYSTLPEVSEVVVAEVGVAPLFSGFILSWRGDYSPRTMQDAHKWGLSMVDLEFLAAICVEQSAVIHRVHQTSTLVRRGRRGPGL